MSRKNVLLPMEQGHAGAPSAIIVPGPAIAPLRSLGRIVSGLREENERAAAVLEVYKDADPVLEISPALIDPSFAKDRMAPFEPEGADAGFVAAIREQGQLVPVLLRKSPQFEGRFQPAYGRRRIAAAAFLGCKVRAVVRSLTDEQLVVAQGQENEARNALTYIEKCRFAAILERHGFSRKVIESALNVYKSDLSNMLQVVARVPVDIIDWIGPAPDVGGPRWRVLADKIREPKSLNRAKQIVSRERLEASNLPSPPASRESVSNKKLEASYASSSDRFAKVFAAITPSGALTKPQPWRHPAGEKPYGNLAVTGRAIVLKIDRKAHPALADLALRKLDQMRVELDAADIEPTSKKG